jgi:spore germination protein GerM
MTAIDSSFRFSCHHLLAAATLLLSAACGAPPGQSEPELSLRGAGELPAAQLVVYFTRGEEPDPVYRAVPPGTDTDMLTLALQQLLRGPTVAEREDGLTSWFSAETSDLLIEASIDEEGHAVVNFADFRPIIPGASSSAGSRILLTELTGTVAQFEAVRSIEYQLAGSCHRFWVFLQHGCEILQLQASTWTLP